jgi:hypothetical protein
MLVINQNKDSNSDETAGVVVDEPLCIPDEIVSVDVTTVCRSPTSVEAKPITVDKFNFHSNDHLVRKYEVNDRVWLMASFSHTERSSIVGNATPEELSASPCVNLKLQIIPNSVHLNHLLHWRKQILCRLGQLLTLYYNVGTTSSLESTENTEFNCCPFVKETSNRFYSSLHGAVSDSRYINFCSRS